jgi:hypothetical protein
MPRKLTICLDFDGVVHAYTSGWKGASIIPDGPVPGAISMIMKYLDAGFIVAIYSSRSKSLFGRRAMRRWLARHIANDWAYGGESASYAECECRGDAAALVDKLSWPWFKPAAFITIDDRCLTFDGNWNNPRYSPEKVRGFKTWQHETPNYYGETLPAA